MKRSFVKVNIKVAGAYLRAVSGRPTFHCPAFTYAMPLQDLDYRLLLPRLRCGNWSRRQQSFSFCHFLLRVHVLSLRPTCLS